MIHNISIILSLSLVMQTATIASTGNAGSDLEVSPIAENVYSIVSPSFGLPTPENKGWNSNVHFVVTGKGVLLFDTGSSQQIGLKIKRAIGTVTDQPVRWIVNSHSHADHWLGNMAFADTANEIIASGQAVATMQKYGEDDVKFYAKVTDGTIGPTQLRYPNSILTTGQKRNFGEIDVTFIFSNNGHSPGDILMWLPKQKILFGGDVASSDHMPMITDHGDIPGLIKVLFTVAELHPDIVLTGHGNATTAKSITRDANLLTSLWEIVKENHSNGKMPDETLVEVSAELGPQYEPLYIDFVSEIDRHIDLMYQLQ